MVRKVVTAKKKKDPMNRPKGRSARSLGTAVHAQARGIGDPINMGRGACLMGARREQLDVISDVLIGKIGHELE